MADDNVVRPTFGKKKDDKAKVPEPSEDEYALPDPDAPPLEGEALVRAMRDLAFVVEDQQYVHETRELINQIHDYIFKLGGFSPRDANIKLRREGLKSSTLKDLCAQVRNTNKLQWNTNPSFFGALTLEYHYRMQAVLSLLQE